MKPNDPNATSERTSICYLQVVAYRNLNDEEYEFLANTENEASSKNLPTSIYDKIFAFRRWHLKERGLPETAEIIVEESARGDKNSAKVNERIAKIFGVTVR